MHDRGLITDNKEPAERPEHQPGPARAFFIGADMDERLPQ
jgi:hypothetical protein